MDLVDSFCRHLKAEGRAARTLVIYTQAVRFFCEWLREQGREETLAELTRPAVRDWIGSLAEQRESSTVRTRFISLRRFCNWLVAEGELEVTPMAGLRAPGLREKPVPVIDDDDLKALIKACGGKGFNERRDEAMIRLLLDTGIRISELCGLTLDNLMLKQETAIVHGKGGKIRAVYFGPRTAQALDRYLRERRRHRWAHLDAVFLTQRGALSADGARGRMEVIAERAGLADRFNPHRFRHTYAHDFLMNGGQERDLKRIAGWSSDIMLERYGASAADARARAAAQRMRRGDRV
jgi:site-specific recombinase XerD